MYCNTPTVAYRRSGIDPATGKHYKPWTFARFKSDDQVRTLFESVPPGNDVLLLPCGKCLLCTKRYRMHWVLRCLHEAHYFDQMCYLTLTVDDAHIGTVFPPLGFDWIDGDTVWYSLQHKPWQDFLKRLRRQLSYGFHYDQVIDGQPVHHVYHGEPGKNLRFFMCGEYGDKSHRPHYHAIIFGFWPPDARRLHDRSNLFISQMIADRWPFGIHTVARVERACISYVAGYCDKKLDNSRMDWAVNNVAPEYVCMSRGCSRIGTGGIGRQFFDDFYKELYPLNDDGSFARNFAMIGDGLKVKMPRYYDSLLDLRDKPLFDTLCAVRDEVGARHAQELDIDDWLNESHRRHAVAVARRRQRDPGVDVDVGSSTPHVANLG